MIMMLVGRSDRRVSLMDISDPTKPVQLGSDVILPNNPISITISVKGKDTFAYVVSEGNLSIINLNLPKGPTASTKALNLPLGAGPNSFTVKQDGSFGYALGNGGSVLFPIDLSSPSTAELGVALTLPEFAGNAVRFLNSDTVLGVTAKNSPIFMRIKTPVPGEALSIQNLTLNTGCTSSFIASTISAMSYVAGGKCLSSIYLNPITPPPAFPNPLFRINTTLFEEAITALAPSSIFAQACVAAGKLLWIIQDNQTISSYNLPQGARAIIPPVVDFYVYISPNSSDQFISLLDMIGKTLTNIPMPWAGPYPCLATVSDRPYGLPGSPPGDVEEEPKGCKPKKCKPKKAADGCRRCRKCGE